MSETPSDDIQGFFADFARAAANADVAATATQFADTFISADPTGSKAVPRDAFIATLPQRHRLFSEIGMTGERLETLTQTTLDDHYVLVKTEWVGEFADDESANDDFRLSSSFILRRDADGLRIVLYLNHHDVTELIHQRRNRA